MHKFWADHLSHEENEIFSSAFKQIQNYKVNPVVTWPHSTSYKYYSVVAATDSYYTNFNQLFVKYGASGDVFLWLSAFF